MQDKFRERFEVLRGEILRANYGSNPWQDRNQVITSMPWVSRVEDAKDSLLRSHWDLVIVDEAHKMSAYSLDHKTLAYRLGEALSELTDHYLLMTATPHKGDTGQQEGTFKVTASAGKVQGTATVDVLKEPAAQLVRLEGSPQEVSLGRGEARTFTVKGFDQHGRMVPLSKVVWTAGGGSIDAQGLFRAGQAEGSFEVTASCGELVTTSRVTIKGVNARREGEVPHQRWSQFYNKVLMRHVMGKKLKLKVEVELQDVTSENVEQMRIALQELGLDDDVQAS